MQPTHRQSPPTVHFYLLDYFYVLLRSVRSRTEREQAFDMFRNLKQQYRLGESKYRRLLSEDHPTKVQLDRYRFTFDEVVREALEYDLIVASEDSTIGPTKLGEELLDLYDTRGHIAYARRLLVLMEKRHGVFRHLLEGLYKANTYKSGLVIFPIYSPRQLHFERSAVRTTEHILHYSEVLAYKLHQDIERYLGRTVDLTAPRRALDKKLLQSGLIPEQRDHHFDPKKYNAIIKRFRDYWLTYFLSEIYKLDYSLSSFDRWIYRGKQIGIVQATEFYPNFLGRLVYPTAVLDTSVASDDFQSVFEYSDGKHLYLHWPEHSTEQFVDSLVKAYFDLRRSNRSYFINLSALRELVCYHLKISDDLFDKMLDHAYRLNLGGQLKVKISLEVDRLPEETKAMYLKQAPVEVDGKFRNIIAIDVRKTEAQS